MRIVFAGTPAFAATALTALLGTSHEVLLVLTQPDRPAGRGLRPAPSPVKQLAQERGIPFQQPVTLRDGALTDALNALGPDVLVVAAYGLIVPARVLSVPTRGCINIHASLLPRWRGAAPIQRAILAGDPVTGITIMQMDEGLDTGAMLLQRALPIADDDTAGSLHDKLALLGADLILEALATNPVAVPQDGERATYAAKIQKSETQIEWQNEASAIARQIRAFNPVPGAVTAVGGGTPLKIWSASVVHGVAATPGTVCEADSTGLLVACGKDALRITELQRAGGKRLTAAAFVVGHSLRPGARLGD
jgi:methionyl-tRNA formyltransferase